MESFLEPIDHCKNNPNKSFTVSYNKHTPSGFCYTIKCFDESIYPNRRVLYTMQETGEDIGKKFVECLEKEVFKILDTDKPITMSEADEANFQKTEDCYACGKLLGEGRVRDHCHLTGKYRGAANNDCNLKMRTPNFVPVLFTDLIVDWIEQRYSQN